MAGRGMQAQVPARRAARVRWHARHRRAADETSAAVLRVSSSRSTLCGGPETRRDDGCMGELQDGMGRGGREDRSAGGSQGRRRSAPPNAQLHRDQPRPAGSARATASPSAAPMATRPKQARVTPLAPRMRHGERSKSRSTICDDPACAVSGRGIGARICYVEPLAQSVEQLPFKPKRASKGEQGLAIGVAGTPRQS